MESPVFYRCMLDTDDVVSIALLRACQLTYLYRFTSCPLVLFISHLFFTSPLIPDLLFLALSILGLALHVPIVHCPTVG
ncbi:hypothetical protein IW261DRAFT_1532188 [Armillaria novae-zelandiae]|uniref:Uncharacterized protein n=1 Tax=Armillaria novae-zelandiae TaxID=153914 RepID=A0AA39N8B6_9AGAR|nr:hypothetical protein IW261DRAFT_1532188 [Armillaria novae-zelandiae]